ncbi:MAG: ribonuclease III domain-containing protein [Leptolyngbyaceae cyanobacterium bins.349]|nr:ribonuclease III domain-containing protein [Leptolyngbyaceae cyanobacterium bins.349]
MPTNIDSLTSGDCPSDVVSEGQLLVQGFESRRLSTAQIQQLSPAALAYIGDAVYELFIRRCFLTPPQRIQSYHQQVVAQVRAEAQAHHLQMLIPHLTPMEMEWVKRGRNAATGRPRRVDPDIYQQATSLEALVGYLYLTNAQRLMELLNLLHLTSVETTQSSI